MQMTIVIGNTNRFIRYATFAAVAGIMTACHAIAPLHGQSVSVHPSLVCSDPGIPSAVQIPAPSQPTGVTSGACQPCISAVDCSVGGPGPKRWCDAAPTNFQPLIHGEYIGPVRLPALLEYRVRVNDEITFTYIPNRERSQSEYRLMVGDSIQMSSVSDESLRRDKITVQPDGKIYVPVLDTPIEASGKTISQLRKDLEAAYKKFIVSPAINVESVSLNTALVDLLDSVNGPYAAGGRAFPTVVNPDGRIQLPMVGGVYVLGLTFDEIKREINLRYRDKVAGIDVEPRFTREAPHFFHVYGQVAQPGRFEMTGPTTVTAGLAQAGGITVGGNGRQVVIFRREQDWRLVSTVLDLRGVHLGKVPSPSDEIFLRDSDLIIVPERPITRFGQAAQLIFTDGIYRVIPFSIQQ
jgi:polysaccharide export outer membrane protein